MQRPSQLNHPSPKKVDFLENDDICIGWHDEQYPWRVFPCAMWLMYSPEMRGQHSFQLKQHHFLRLFEWRNLHSQKALLACGVFSLFCYTAPINVRRSTATAVERFPNIYWSERLTSVCCGSLITRHVYIKQNFIITPFILPSNRIATARPFPSKMKVQQYLFGNIFI